MNYNKEELDYQINVEKLSYAEIGRRRGVTGEAVKKAAKRLELFIPTRNRKPEGWLPHNYPHKIKPCKQCGEDIRFKSGKQYCSKQCSALAKSANSYKDFIENNDSYCRGDYSPSTFKPIFLQEQDNKCAICEITNTWNNKLLILVLDHIDGDASNNKRDNLRLICHNCDSQLDTYKSKNKNSARKERYLKNYKNSKLQILLVTG